jgi:hypothetical protein
MPALRRQAGHCLAAVPEGSGEPQVEQVSDDSMIGSGGKNMPSTGEYQENRRKVTGKVGEICGVF